MTQLSEAKRAMLSTIASSPRNLRHFLHDRVINPLNEATARMRLDQLVAHGYLSLSADQYSITVKGRQTLDEVRIITPSRTLNNASSREAYDGRELRAFEGRPGANDHQKFTSGAWDHAEKKESNHDQ